jgi:hypothetical protein
MLKRRTIFFVYLLLNSICVNAQYTHVLELFTYDGCASCILANRKIKRLHDEGYFEKNGILQLTYHVDFDASDGFTDILNTDFNRQRLLNYKKNGLVYGLYTPIMVWDGAFAFPAAQLPYLDSLLGVSKIPTKGEIPIVKIHNAVIDEDSILVSTSFNAASDSISALEINSLLVKKDDRHHIQSGENSGAMRYDANAVFAAEVRNAKFTHHSTLKFSQTKPFDVSQWAVIVILENRLTGEIMGFDTFQLHE